LLILPFFVFKSLMFAMLFVFIMVILIIYAFNVVFYRNNQFYKHFYEMLTICITVSVIAFIIGQVAKCFCDI